MSPDICPNCATTSMQALAAALAEDDLDLAISLGLLDFTPKNDPCAACAEQVEVIVLARDVRLRALAARERHRARQARLAARAQARARKRMPAPPTPESKPPSLPAAAASALARAKAIVAAKQQK